ncbi:MAG: S1C family serine protease, partial [Thiohalomonas sp.]|nr:S1C family serine protease [Thiohalomonas sp.]
MSKGIISARYKPGEIDLELPQTELIQTDAAINQDNSAGPMFNDKGEVIAIVSHIIPNQLENAGSNTWKLSLIRESNDFPMLGK